MSTQHSNGSAAVGLLKLLLPALLAVAGSYVASLRGFSALEARMEERTTAMKEELRQMRVDNQREHTEIKTDLAENRGTLAKHVENHKR